MESYHLCVCVCVRERGEAKGGCLGEVDAWLGVKYILPGSVTFSFGNLEEILIKCLCHSCSKPSNASGFKARTPTISSPFTFRSEERAAKRKEARLDPIVLVFYFLLYVMI